MQAGIESGANTELTLGGLAYIGEKVQQRRHEPRDDILSKIVSAGDAGLLEDGSGEFESARGIAQRSVGRGCEHPAHLTDIGDEVASFSSHVVGAEPKTLPEGGQGSNGV